MILDEAHNIEDVCRDSASLTVHLNDLTSFMQECEKAAESGNFPEEHAQMVDQKTFLQFRQLLHLILMSISIKVDFFGSDTSQREMDCLGS